MTISGIIAIVFLLASSLLTGVSSVIGRLGKGATETIASGMTPPAKWVFRKKHRDLCSYSITLTKNIFLIIYSISAFAFAVELESNLLIGGLIILGIALISDGIFRMISLFRPYGFFRNTCQIASLLLLILWPLSHIFFRGHRKLIKSSKASSTFRIRDRILEILHDSEFAPHLDPNDQKLILSVVSFKERIAREVMVPRIDMYTMDAKTSIREAAKGFLEEGYSRIPVWKESVDNIIGALYYKDLLNIYLTHTKLEKQLDAPIEEHLKPIVYTPETKKISQLLQEFRSKQIHLAIVVDEYGGTEGIVTIEDILEELVGEIADEYDFDEESLFSVLPSGGWIVDAKMTIIDIEEELGIQIPQNPEYDTIGGYIFHKAGAIPTKGWRLHQDAFDLEVLSSSERTIEKIRISPH